MGVPAFFRWLSKKYPAIVAPCDEEAPQEFDFDNLYLDMNGIIHPCTHPENKAPPETEQEMFDAIFEYIERLMKIVRPKKLLYMAVDGVAPRAKMNQQRSRRFRASKESIEKKIEIQTIKDELRSKGIIFPDDDKKHGFDSNVITPGTDFMINLSRALREWIDKKMGAADEDPEGIWAKEMVVILSDASAPGEGEHKIIDYIRKQKVNPDYNPNLSHLLCGADADLIHLGLATHEMKFTILREEFIPNQARPCEICGQLGHEMKECLGDVQDPTEAPIVNSEPGFIYIKLPVLREYLQKESKGLDLERFIDDFVFLCFFVGNDFLPHLPSLEIREGAIDRLLGIYHDMMANQTSTKKFLTENGFVAMENVQVILTNLGTIEDEIFKKRKYDDKKFKERRKRQKVMQNRDRHNAQDSPWMRPQALGSRDSKPGAMGNARQEAYNMRMMSNNQSAAQNLKAMLKTPGEESNQKRKFDDANSGAPPKDEDSEPEDDVQLGCSGWKERYYYHKFDTTISSNISGTVAREYVIGLCWVLRYYYQGCADWQWFYPFHYAPFASDFLDIDSMVVKFNRESTPFKPLEQLMSVFPAASSTNLPASWRKLMMQTESSIIDFYPSDFKIDLNGKRAAWMGVALLPFIDESRLFKALEPVYPNLNAEEKERNSHGPHLVFCSLHMQDAQEFVRELKSSPSEEPVAINHASFSGMFGQIQVSRKYTHQYGKSTCAEYYDPVYPKDYIFPARRLKEAELPAVTLKPEDFPDNSRGAWRPVIGLQRSNTRASLGAGGHRMIHHQQQQMMGGGGPGGSPYRQPGPYQGRGRGSWGQTRGGHSNNGRDPWNKSN